MRKAVFTIALVLITSLAYSDVIQIPFSCYPKETQNAFAKVGKKLDLSGNDRTTDSWAFLKNNGTSYEIVTYAPTSIEELELIRKVVFSKEK